MELKEQLYLALGKATLPTMALARRHIEQVNTARKAGDAKKSETLCDEFARHMYGFAKLIQMVAVKNGIPVEGVINTVKTDLSMANASDGVREAFDVAFRVARTHRF